MKLFAAVTIIAALTLSMSCGTDESAKPPMTTITLQEANTRVEKYITDAVTGLAPQPRLELLSREEAGDCSDPTDHGALGRVLASRGFWLRDIPEARNADMINTLVQWWKDHNFVILADDRPSRNYVWAENKADGFRMAVQESAQGDLSLGATSPCVWPNGTPTA
jgi:hypothetical protein